MSKAIIVVDFAYKGPQRKGRGTGPKGLRGLLRYLHYRDTRNNNLAQEQRLERWTDRGLGQHHGEIYQNVQPLQSKHVLAWTWVISPAPDLMALVPEDQRRDLVCDLTERIVEDYYTARDLNMPEYSYVLHDRETTQKDDEDPQQHLHTHVILPGTVPSIAGRQPVYNNASQGHDRLFRDIASRHFAQALDEIVGPGWRRERGDLAHELPRPRPDKSDLDYWFPR